MNNYILVDLQTFCVTTTLYVVRDNRIKHTIIAEVGEDLASEIYSLCQKQNIDKIIFAGYKNFTKKYAKDFMTKYNNNSIEIEFLEKGEPVIL